MQSTHVTFLSREVSVDCVHGYSRAVHDVYDLLPPHPPRAVESTLDTVSGSNSYEGRGAPTNKKSTGREVCGTTHFELGVYLPRNVTALRRAHSTRGSHRRNQINSQRSRIVWPVGAPTHHEAGRPPQLAAKVILLRQREDN